MDQIEHLPASEVSPARSPDQPASNHGRAKTALRSGAMLAAFGLAAGALGLAIRPGDRRAGRPPPNFAPADRTLAWASPAVLAASPQRRFYSGTNLDHAATVEDLRAMAHRRLPDFVLEYLEAGGEDEAALARNIAALAEWRFLHRSLVDVSRRDASTELFDRKMKSRSLSRRRVSTSCSGQTPTCGWQRQRLKWESRLCRAQCLTTRCPGSHFQRGREIKIGGRVVKRIGLQHKQGVDPAGGHVADQLL
jgi:FMN-dependent dehydrogenase